MYLVSTLDTKEEVLNVLNEIEHSNEPGTSGNYLIIKFTI